MVEENRWKSDVIEPPESAEGPPAEQPEPGGWLAGVEPDDAPRSRGRPLVKGQSGNPAGRPPKRAHVANGLISRKTIPLTLLQIDLALAGDKTMLRLCREGIPPSRHEAPIDLQLPPIEDRAGVCAATLAVANAAMNGTITSAQSLKLLQMLREAYALL